MTKSKKIINLVNDSYNPVDTKKLLTGIGVDDDTVINVRTPVDRDINVITGFKMSDKNEAKGDEN